MDRELIIVAGVSSAGKSTFIENSLMPDLTRTERHERKSTEIDIKFAGQLRTNFDLGNNKTCIVHYNSLLKFDTNRELDSLVLDDEPVFNNLLNNAYLSSVYLCYAPDNVLLQRIGERTAVEPVLSMSPGSYPKEHILASFNKVNQRQLLLEMAAKFSHVTQNIKVVFSNEGESSVISVNEFRYGIPDSALENAIACN